MNREGDSLDTQFRYALQYRTVELKGEKCLPIVQFKEQHTKIIYKINLNIYQLATVISFFPLKDKNNILEYIYLKSRAKISSCI